MRGRRGRRGRRRRRRAREEWKIWIASVDGRKGKGKERDSARRDWMGVDLISEKVRITGQDYTGICICKKTERQWC